MTPEVLEVLSNRHNPQIDPRLDIWEWQIPAYLFVGGLVAGLMVLMAALELRRKAPAPARAAQWMPVVALVLISLGMLFLFLDLANKPHVYRFYTAFRPTSAMSWGSWILLLVYPALALLWLGGLDRDRRAWLVGLRLVRALRLPRLIAWLTKLADQHRRKIVWTTLMVGVGLGVYTGLLLGTMVARPVWNSAVMGPLFLTSGISTGAALMLLTPQDETDTHTLVRWDIVAILVELALLVVLLIGFSTGSAAARAVADGFLGGAYTATFWSLVVMVGLVTPLVLNLLEVRRKTPMTAFAPAFVLVGGLVLRILFVASGQATGIGG
ncbi:MAG: polysulfide reductase NrfD [Deltaproteobacteria bacterium]|jgi:formate-dependent nitrite reductase membrane component NrfD|nr:polysulfide reductase NrfD [Deltaproteobacteria bacterium]